MNQIIYIIFVFVSLLAVSVVKKYDNVLGIILSLAAAAIVITESLSSFENIIVKLNDFTLNTELFEIPLKAMGITLITQIIVSICEDAGEKLMCFTVSFVSKISIVIITMPIMEEILNLLSSITNGI